MNRRRLLSYAAMMVCGIFTAEMALEDGRLISSAAIVLSVILALILLFRSCGEAYHLNMAQCRWMVIFLIWGMLVFCVQYSQLLVNTVTLESDQRAQIEGVIRRSQVYPDHISYVIDAELPSGMRRILCNVYISDGDEAADPYSELIADRTYVSFYGELRIPDAARNPGCFDYRKYLKSKRIVYTTSAKVLQVTGVSMSIPDRCSRLLQKKRNAYRQLFRDQPEVQSFLQGAIFGERSMIDEDTYAEFTGNGTAHILAVSGLHIGFLIGLMSFLTQKRKHWRLAMVIFIVLLLYGEMTGWSASTVRAVIVAGIAMGAIYVRRPFDLTSALAASAILALAIQPYQLFQSGFLMSYAALLGIAFLIVPLGHFVGRQMAAMLALQIAIVPYSIYTFNRFNPLTILVNIPIVFLASILIPMAVVLFVLQAVLGWVPGIGSLCLSALTGALIKINRLLYMEGRYSVLIPSMKGWPLLLCYVLLLLFSSELFRVMVLRADRRAMGQIIRILLIPILSFGVATIDPFANDSVVFVDVGQGDAIHVRAEGYNVLIDGGGNEHYSVGQRVLQPYLLKNGAAKLDVSLCTHLHMDHYKGVQELSAHYPIRMFAIPSVYEKRPEAPASARYIEAGDTLSLGDDVRITMLWPLTPKPGAEPPAEEDENKLNGVYRIDIGEVRVLVTGDLLAEGEAEMLRYYANTDALRCDVLKVAHHGSKSSSSEAFLDAVDPRIAVIQVGARNRYGHPHAQTLERLEKRGIPVYRTDLDGAVGLRIKNGAITGVHKMVNEY